MVNKRKILIILNPVAGRNEHKKFAAIIQILENNNLDIKIVKTSEAGHGKILAQQNINAGYDMIIAAGGDGTINEVLNGIYPSSVPFGIIPLGTVNILAKEIALLDSSASIAQCIIDAHHRPCWLGKSNGRYFSLMISAGLDALSVANVSPKLKRLIGKNAYAMSFLTELIRSKNLKYTVTADGKIYDASNVIVTNGKFYGGEFICAPDARLEDRQLYLLMSVKFGRWSAVKAAYLMLTNKYYKSNDVIILPVERITVSCSQSNVPLQMDGDSAGYLPISITCSKSSINLIQPKK